MLKFTIEDSIDDRTL